MAIFPSKKTPPSLLLLLLFLMTTAPSTTGIPTQVLDTVLTLLRTNSHALFANAIATSDLFFDLLSLSSLTLLCPPGPQLFALDMASISPLSYTSSLRSHVIPNSSLTRLIIPPPLSRNGSDGDTTREFHTLLPSRDLHVTRDSLTGVVTVDGVEVVPPRLYYSPQISAFHLRGILPADYVPVGESTASPVVPNFNQTVSSPVVSSPTPAPLPGGQNMISDSPVGAPTPVISPMSSFAAGPGPEAGWFSGHNRGDQTVAVRKEGNEVEKCEPLDGENQMQCAVRDGDNTGGVGHVSVRETGYGS